MKKKLTVKQQIINQLPYELVSYLLQIEAFHNYVEIAVEQTTEDCHNVFMKMSEVFLYFVDWPEKNFHFWENAYYTFKEYCEKKGIEDLETCINIDIEV